MQWADRRSEVVNTDTRRPSYQHPPSTSQARCDKSVPCLRCWDRNLLCQPQEPPQPGSPRGAQAPPEDADAQGGGAGADHGGGNSTDAAADTDGPASPFLASFLSRCDLGAVAPAFVGAVTSLLRPDSAETAVAGAAAESGGGAAAAATAGLLDRKLLAATV